MSGVSLRPLRKTPRAFLAKLSWPFSRGYRGLGSRVWPRHPTSHCLRATPLAYGGCWNHHFCEPDLNVAPDSGPSDRVRLNPTRQPGFWPVHGALSCSSTWSLYRSSSMPPAEPKSSSQTWASSARRAKWKASKRPSTLPLGRTSRRLLPPRIFPLPPASFDSGR